MLYKQDRRRLGLALLASAVINILFFISLVFGSSAGGEIVVKGEEFPSLSVAFSRKNPSSEAADQPAAEQESSDEAKDEREPLSPESAVPELPTGEVPPARKVTEEPIPADAPSAETPRAEEATVTGDSATESGASSVPEPERAAAQGAGAHAPGGTNGPVSQEQFLLVLQDLIERNLEYPRRARQRGTEGTVVVELSVAADGRLLAREVRRGSGSSTLDRAALSLIDSLFPVADPPLRRIDCTVGISYRLN